MQTKSVLLLSLIILLTVTIPTAVAQQETTSDDQLRKEFGVSPVVIALGITITGILIRTGLGMAGKSLKDFNYSLLGVSFVMGFFASIPLVITALQHIPADATELGLLQLIIGQIAVVMGIDVGVKAAGKAVTNKLVKRPGD